MPLSMTAGGGFINSSIGTLTVYTAPQTLIESATVIQFTMSQLATGEAKVSVKIAERNYLRKDVAIHGGYSHQIEPFIMKPGENLVVETSDPDAQIDIMFSIVERTK